jgi:hypothetical protein
MKVRFHISTTESGPAAYGQVGPLDARGQIDRPSSKVDRELRPTSNRRRFPHDSLTISSESLQITKEGPYGRARVVSEFLEHGVNIVFSRKSDRVAYRAQIIRAAVAPRLFAHDEPLSLSQSNPDVTMV